MKNLLPPMARPVRQIVVMLFLMVFAGCAKVDPTPDYERTRAIVADATGSADLYIPGQPGEGEDSSIGPTGGMTRNDAVRLALMNNKELQSLMYEIGVSHADAVQAGLLSNPSLDGILRFPQSGGASTLEAGVLQSIFAVFRRPVRQRIAKAHLERKIMEVAFAATNVAAEASMAYINALIAYRAKGVATENLMTARELLFVVKERLSAGVGTQLDVNAAEAEAVEQDLLREQSELDLKSAELALSELMGVEGGFGLLTAALTTARPPDVRYGLETLIELAEKNRLDYRARRVQVEIAKEDLKLEKQKILRQLSVGASIESASEGTEVGPALDVELPLFDQNQAQIAKAEYRLSQAMAKLSAHGLTLRNEVRLALTQHRTARQSVELFEKKLLPLRTESLALAREAFSEGKTNFLFVIESQRQLLQTRREYLVRLGTYLNSIAKVEKAVGLSVCKMAGRLDAGVQETNAVGASHACN